MPQSPENRKYLRDICLANSSMKRSETNLFIQDTILKIPTPESFKSLKNSTEKASYFSMISLAVHKCFYDCGGIE